MNEPLLIAKSGAAEISLLPAVANRHGLISGATGTGKTVTLQTLTEGFSKIGVPVFLADVKGDLAGLAAVGGGNPKIEARALQLGIELQHAPCPCVLWDVFGKRGHPVRATVSDLGPLLLARMLQLNETQQGVLAVTFKIADDAGWLLLDSKDLRAVLQHVGDNAGDFTTAYGNISAASIGTIQRSLLALESQGADSFFGEPMLNITDLLRTEGGRGVVNVLAADQLINAPKLYGTVLLWLLAELYEQMPEVGDLEKPKVVFFFDEAHLLFEDAPKVLLDKIEQVVRLVRSKGVGVYFATQNPLDIPDTVLGQLGNRIQHALRAFTPRDQKAVKAAAQTMRANPALSMETVITELGVGEALVSLLDEQGRPTISQRALIVPPQSRVGPLSEAERAQCIAGSALAGHYERMVDRESAYEKLEARVAVSSTPTAPAPPTQPETPSGGIANDILFGRRGPRGGRQTQGLVEVLAKSAVRTMGSQAGRALMRGLLGSLLRGR